MMQLAARIDTFQTSQSTETDSSKCHVDSANLIPSGLAPTLLLHSLTKEPPLANYEPKQERTNLCCNESEKDYKSVADKSYLNVFLI
jgi:hypothetical protein